MNGISDDDFNNYLTISKPVRPKGKDGKYLNFLVVEISLKDPEVDGDYIFNDRFYMRNGAPVRFC
jgi:hypothetical protein